MSHPPPIREPRVASDLPPFLPPRFVLYQRDDCHLCDLALAVLAEAGFPDFDSVFIDGDDALEAAYGERVPVLRDRIEGAELNWPFGLAMVRRFAAP
jgi:Glutaredoxin-like domain (DUF836)